MWFDLRPVELDFLETAPRRWCSEASLQAPRDAVWRALADASSWPRWFPGVSEASYPGASPPYGVGTRREATVRGQRWQETMLAWDEGTRFAYRVDRTTVPLAKAQLECTELADEGAGGTRLRWTLAADPRWLLRLTSPLMGRTLDDLLRRATQTLDRELAHHALQRTGSPRA